MKGHRKRTNNKNSGQNESVNKDAVAVTTDGKFGNGTRVSLVSVITTLNQFSYTSDFCYPLQASC